jgi:N utilization substance protein B
MADSAGASEKRVRRGFTSRSKSRKRAVDILYEADVREVDAGSLLAERAATPEQTPINDYTARLVEGVAAHGVRIDELLTEHAEGWSVQRMPVVDRAVLRLGLYELLWCDDVPDPVAIDEAVELVKELSTDDSPRFVNGVLGRIGDTADALRAAL